jgi:hypothetical protein
MEIETKRTQDVIFKVNYQEQAQYLSTYRGVIQNLNMALLNEKFSNFS